MKIKSWVIILTIICVLDVALVVTAMMLDLNGVRFAWLTPIVIYLIDSSLFVVALLILLILGIIGAFMIGEAREKKSVRG